MRVLFVLWAYRTHYYHLAPLCWALRAAGHEVRVATQPSLRDVVTAAGGVFVAAGADLDRDELRRRRTEKPFLDELPATPSRDLADDDWRGGWRAKTLDALNGFAIRADDMVDDVIAFGRAWRPDLVVHEATSYAGPLAAAVLGVPSVRVPLGLDSPGLLDEYTPALLASVAGRLGLSSVDTHGTVTVDNTPVSMRLPSSDRRLATRFVPYNGGPEIVSPWLLEPAGGRRVCVTWGTAAVTRGATLLAGDVAEALSAVDAEIVMLMTEEDIRRIEPAPPGVRLVTSLPLHLLLPSCDAIVNQGGSGSVLTAIDRGVPQLVVPQLPDEVLCGRAYAGTGAGEVLTDLRADLLRESVTRLLAEPAYRDAAAKLREEAHGQLSPAALVGELERLVS
ncbi:nucleotide disphospho-sugar-binding domain-containing protein [Actinoallomurus iriomotensis]|uniref:Glycosyl transferase n=1 Tax=Actinoallomurus iriomotensis TaxID=478107 RepID=A0A9W6S0X7_9ACTN|nr:nucleotide disphospho-sugar-binding domain-containing protein [Actinoallomurus iriomotensis]GLY85094.1 glycosyl transferase [Actinoallomurus iriomotensis]